jgi:hypothetical protein
VKRSGAILALILASGACRQPAMPEGVSQAPPAAARAAPGAGWERVTLVSARGPFPSVSVFVPPGAGKRERQGDDTVTHELSFEGGVARLERWVPNSARCAAAAGCSLRTETISGRSATVMREQQGEGQRIVAFIPATRPSAAGPSLGLRFEGSCSSPASCRTLSTVLGSIDFA